MTATPVQTSVTTESGLLSGAEGRDPSITVFRGIPYAAAPVGPLRWREPRSPEAWSGVRAATEFGPVSPQPERPAISELGLPMSEDCLHLNVWTGAAEPDEARPVLVWIYGGGFQEGTAADPRFDGENLARKGIVVVTFDYRLGALGFLATPALSAESGHEASGNYGLLDCVAALRWVQRNIANFGGDPARVTIAGQSAGAGTVNFLAMSPLASGLFQRAIAQSHARFAKDTELRYLSTSYRTKESAEREGERFVGARVAPADAADATTPDALRALPWQAFVDGSREGDMAVETGSDARPPLFRPVIDGWMLPAGYADTYAAGRQSPVAYLAGNNLDETGAIPEETFAAVREAGEQPWRPGRPPVHVTLVDFVDSARQKFGALADEFLALYPASTDDEAARASNDAVRDNARVSTYFWGVSWTEHCAESVHTYFWTHRAPTPNDGPRRASHASEIDYVFDNLDVIPGAWNDEDRAVARTMSGYWTNFIRTGDPNGAGLPDWPAYAPAATRVMELGAAPAPLAIATPERIDFWRRFFDTQPAW